jgi:hypothetical protein
MPHQLATAGCLLVDGVGRVRLQVDGDLTTPSVVFFDPRVAGSVVVRGLPSRSGTQPSNPAASNNAEAGVQEATRSSASEF